MPREFLRLLTLDGHANKACRVYRPEKRSQAARDEVSSKSVVNRKSLVAFGAELSFQPAECLDQKLDEDFGLSLFEFTAELENEQNLDHLLREVKLSARPGLPGGFIVGEEHLVDCKLRHYPDTCTSVGHLHWLIGPDLNEMQIQRILANAKIIRPIVIFEG